MNEKPHTDPDQPANKQEDLSSIRYASLLVSGPEHEVDISEETYEDALFNSDTELEEHLAATTDPENTAGAATTEEIPVISNEPLFDSEAALDLALEEADEKKLKETSNTESVDKCATSNVSDNELIEPSSAAKPTRMDLSVFLPAPNRSYPQQEDGLSIEGNDFNRYPTAAKMSVGSSAMQMTDIKNLNFPTAASEPDTNAHTETLEHQDENKIKDKAKLFYSDQKAKFDEYFGRSLPDRSLDLDFHFTSLKAKKDFDYIVRGIDIDKAFKTKGKPAESLFKEADENLQNLSKCKISRGNRLRLLNTYCNYLIPLYESVIHQQNRKPNASGDAKRTAIAEHCCNAIKHLITGYKQIYSEIYQAPNLAYGPQRDFTNDIAYKIIDLIAFEQIIHAALQMPAQRTSIAAINNLYLALREYEPQELAKQKKSISTNRPSSINELFVHFQVLLCFDFLSISPTLHPSLFSYLREQQQLVKIVEPENVAMLDEPVLIVQYQQSEAPTYDTKLNTPTIAPVFIQAQALFTQVSEHLNDYKKALGKTQSAGICKSFASLSNLEAMSLLATLKHNIDIIEKHIKPKVYEVYRPQKMQACAGLAQIFKYLDYQLALNRKQTLEKNEEDVELPQKLELDKGKWAIAAEEDGFIYLQAHTNLLIDVGDLILLAQNNADVETSRIARVNRVERADHGKSNLIVETLATEFTAARVTRSNNKLTPAILARQDEKNIVILNADEPIHNGQVLKIRLANGQKVEFAVKGIYAGNKKIQILAIV